MSPRSHRCEEKPDDRGAALVEMALVINLLVVLLLGIISFGMLLGYQESLVGASADAARTMAVTTDPDLQGPRAIAAIDTTLGGYGRACGTSGLVCEVGPPAACENEPALTCRTITLRHDHTVDPVYGPVPFIAALLPNTSEATVTAIVPSASSDPP